MKKVNYVQTILASAVLSLSLSGCGNKDVSQNVNEKIIEGAELVSDLENEILEEVKNKEKVFNKKDIYIFVSPDDNGSFGLKFLEKIQENEFQYILLNWDLDMDIETYENLKTYEIKENNLRYWNDITKIIPDCDYGFAIRATEIDLFTKDEYTFKDLSQISTQIIEEINNCFENDFDENEKFNLDQLILVNCEGHYSIYYCDINNCQAFSYGNEEDYMGFYFYDLIDRRNGLKALTSMPISEYDGKIYFDNDTSYKITSLNKDYAESFQDKELKVEFGYTKEGTLNGNRILLSDFWNYITSEQIQNGYLTYSEIKALLKDLNNSEQLKYTIEMD